MRDPETEKKGPFGPPRWAENPKRGRKRSNGVRRKAKEDYINERKGETLGQVRY